MRGNVLQFIVIKVLNKGPKSQLRLLYNGLGNRDTSLRNWITTTIVVTSAAFFCNVPQYQGSHRYCNCDSDHNLKSWLWYTSDFWIYINPCGSLWINSEVKCMLIKGNSALFRPYHSDNLFRLKETKGQLRHRTTPAIPSINLILITLAHPRTVH